MYGKTFSSCVCNGEKFFAFNGPVSTPVIGTTSSNKLAGSLSHNAPNKLFVVVAGMNNCPSPVSHGKLSDVEPGPPQIPPAALHSASVIKTPPSGKQQIPVASAGGQSTVAQFVPSPA